MVEGCQTLDWLHEGIILGRGYLMRVTISNLKQPTLIGLKSGLVTLQTLRLILLWQLSLGKTRTMHKGSMHLKAY